MANPIKSSLNTGTLPAQSEISAIPPAKPSTASNQKIAAGFFDEAALAASLVSGILSSPFLTLGDAFKAGVGGG